MSLTELSNTAANMESSGGCLATHDEEINNNDEDTVNEKYGMPSTPPPTPSGDSSVHVFKRFDCDEDFPAVKGVDVKSADVSHSSAAFHQQQQLPSGAFGICFDVDGVLAHGTVAIPAAVEAFKMLSRDSDGDSGVINNFEATVGTAEASVHRHCDGGHLPNSTETTACRRRHLKFPVNFVTNSLNRPADRVQLLANLLNVELTVDQLIQAPSPLQTFTNLHDKFCLIVGQGMVEEIAHELGFKRFCSIEDLTDAYPLLDVVDHDKRKRIAREGFVEKQFERVEAVILMGEPKRWESALQIIIDLLRSDGLPKTLQMDAAATSSRERTVSNGSSSTSRTCSEDEHIPVIACNMDLQFKDRAASPRFGHGAFLACLEALYKKVTGRHLQYMALVGKPSEITFSYAEMVLEKQARKLGETRPLTTMYFVGDTPEVDIAGANFYQRYVDGRRRQRQNSSCNGGVGLNNGSTSDSYAGNDGTGDQIPESRRLPDVSDEDQEITQWTVEKVVPLLVCTGVYRPHGDAAMSDLLPVDHGHRDFRLSADTSLCQPAKIFADVFEAVRYALEIEQNRSS